MSQLRNSSRIILRRLTSADLADFQSYRNDQDVGLCQGWSQQSDADALKFLQEMGAAEFFRPGTWFQIGIADRDTNSLLGDIGICVRHDEVEAEIGFSLRRQSHGLGLGSEAVREAISYIFDSAKCDQVIAITDTRNLSAIRLLEGLGMQRTSTDGAVFRGQPCEEHTFVLQR